MTRLATPLLRAALAILLTVPGMVAWTGQSVSASQGVDTAPCAPGDVSGNATPRAAGDVDTWTQLTSMPRPRSEVGAAAIDGTIYVVGGFGGEAFLDCYNAATGSWSVGVDLPVGVHHPGVTALDGLVYVAGGYAADGGTGAVWAYDPATDSWSERAPLPTPRGALGLVALDGRLYTVGGALETLGGPVSDAVEVYDPATDNWESLPGLPTPREHLAVVAGDGRVYAVGGRAGGDESDPLASAVEAFDPVTGRWEVLAPLPTPRGGFAGAFVNGQVVVAGGERGTTSFDTVEAYDPATDSWRPLTPMPTARHGVAAVAICDTFYVIAGSTVAGSAQSTGALESIRIDAPPGA